jgi:hypothetical protein
MDSGVITGADERKENCMRRIILLLLIFAMTIMACSKKEESSSAKALRALKKLETNIQVGISYNDYGPALGDAQLGLNMFLETPEAKTRPELTKSLQKVMNHYNVSGTLFKELVERNNCLEPKEAKLILDAYPEASTAIATGDGVLGCKSGWMNVKTVMIIIWKKASDELEKATAML